jgi:hypothetical protein
VKAERSFEAIPVEAAAVLRPLLPRLADEIIATIAREVPDYARPMEGAFGQIVRLGVERALGRFIDLIEGRAPDTGEVRDTYLNLGRGEFHAGRRLDALMAAYRAGARVAWRRFVEAGKEGGLPPEVMYRLGEGIFAYIDEISAESAEGYALEQMAEAGERQRRRRTLVRLLAQDPPPLAEAIRTAAGAAGWPLPPRVAALVADPEEDADADAERLARRLGLGAVGASVQELACVLVPDPDAPDRRRQLEAAVEGSAAALGPTVELGQAALSVQRAAATLRLVVAGRLPGEGLVVAADHLPALLLASDPELAADLAAASLAPLRSLPDGSRARLEETLRAWLDRPGQVQAIAATLGVHPQTVRYRLRQLRELFGARLEDPEDRFELSMALRAS